MTLDKKLFSTFLLLCLIPSTIFVYAIIPVPLSTTDPPPIIDGIFSPGEWAAHQIFIKNNTQMNGLETIQTYVYFVNDQNFLYVMVDATGDPTDSGDGDIVTTDECLLVFHNEGERVDVEVLGKGGTEFNNGFYARIGFGPSPNNPNNHKIYEFRIPLSYINAQMGDVIDFCSPLGGKAGGSMPYDGENFRDNVWPEGLDENDLDTWDLIELQHIIEILPVGGEILPNILQLIPGILSIIIMLVLGLIKLIQKEVILN
jgi:hypothetical protein